MDWFTSSNGYINFDDAAQGEDREFLVVGLAITSRYVFVEIPLGELHTEQNEWIYT